MLFYSGSCQCEQRQVSLIIRKLIMQRLLVSVRGPSEAVAAAKGGAHIADVEFPASALARPTH